MDRRVTSSAWGPYLLSNWFMWILRDAKRSLPSITPASVFITKFWPETWLLVSGLMVRKRGKSVRARRPLFNFFSSLRASCLWHSGGGAGKGRRACNYVSELWISASKSRCEMLVGEGDISSDVIILCSCFSMFVYIRARFRFALIGRNLTAQSTGSHRELEVEFKFQRRSCKLSFLFPPRF